MKQPVYVLAASVPPDHRILQFFGDDPDGIQYLLMKPPRFRSAGFDLYTLDTPHPGPDDSWEVKNGDRKVLRAYQDGTLVFRAAADDSFLGWGIEHPQFLAYPRLNPVPVVEIHASFVQLYAQVIAKLNKPPTEVRFRLTLANAVLDGTRLFLTEYFRVPIWQVADPRKYVIHSDLAEEQLTVPAAKVLEKPNAVAYDLVARFAAMFDMPEDRIPFVREVAGSKEIDIEQIQKLSG